MAKFCDNCASSLDSYTKLSETSDSLQKDVAQELRPILDPISSGLALFSDCPETFDPARHWLDGSSPSHPLFEQSERIQEIVHHIKDKLLESILQGCRIILESIADQPGDHLPILRRSLKSMPELWKAIVSVQRYGVIYLADRAEARRAFRPLVREHPTEAEIIHSFLQEGNNIRAVNYAVHSLVTGGYLQVDTPGRLVPPNAISSISERHVAIRLKDFEKSATEMLHVSTPQWDLHDFAHLATATLSSELYGNKYFDKLIYLPSTLTSLVRSPGMKTGKGPKLSDGMVYSELLTCLFTQKVDAVLKGEETHTYKSLMDTLAESLASYLLGRIPLLHLSTQTMMEMASPITPSQLAVLAQNKAYELPASEIEQRCFTRGGQPVDKDPLAQMVTARERIEFLATSRSWLYFEARNTIKHRAHKEAYRRVCLHFLAQGVEVALCQKILENIMYKDWKSGERRDLWALF